MSDDRTVNENKRDLVDPNDDILLSKIQNDFMVKQKKFRNLSQKSFI